MNQTRRHNLYTLLSVPLIILCLMVGCFSVLAQESTTQPADTTDQAGLSGPGSLTVNLATYQGPVPDAAFRLYRVGFTLDGTLVSPYLETQVNLTELKTYEETMTAAYRLKDVADAQQPLLSGATDANGKLVFEKLPEGVYLLIKGEDSTKVVARPSLLTIPAPKAASGGVSLSDSTAEYTYDVQVNPKAEIQPEGKCSLSVKKYYRNTFDEGTLNLWTKKNEHIKVGLFYDEKGTAPASEMKQLTVEGDSGIVTFDNLDPGTYYILESYDGQLIHNGNIAVDENGEEFFCTVQEEGSTQSNNVVELKLSGVVSDEHKDYIIENSYFDMPDNFFIDGVINVFKTVVDQAGKKITVPDIFYATVYQMVKDEKGELKDTLIAVAGPKALTQNDLSKPTEFHVPVGDKDETFYYHVMETDAQGKPVTDATFDYIWKVEDDGKAVLTYDGNGKNPTAQVEITNTIPEENKYSIEVTKKICWFDGSDLNDLLFNNNTHITVGLFYDAEGTKPATDMVTLVDEGEVGTAVFKNLEPGVYYVLEAYDGKLITGGAGTDEKGQEFTTYVTVGEEETNRVELKVADTSVEKHEVTIENMYLDFPDGNYISGNINIDKKVVTDSGDSATVNDTFYVCVYQTVKNADGTWTDNETPATGPLELKNNGTITVNVPVGAEGETSYYHVVETDKDGKPVSENPSFTYVWEVSDDGHASLRYTDSTNPSTDVTITNKVPDVTITVTPTPVPDTPTPTPTPTPTTPEMTTPPNYPSNTPNQAVQQGPSGTEQAGPIKTSDDTPIAMYVIILGIAAAAIIFLVIRKRKK